MFVWGSLCQWRIENVLDSLSFPTHLTVVVNGNMVLPCETSTVAKYFSPKCVLSVPMNTLTSSSVVVVVEKMTSHLYVIHSLLNHPPFPPTPSRLKPHHVLLATLIKKKSTCRL